MSQIAFFIKKNFDKGRYELMMITTDFVEVIRTSLRVCAWFSRKPPGR